MVNVERVTSNMTTAHAEGCDGKACDGSKKCRTVWATERPERAAGFWWVRIRRINAGDPSRWEPAELVWLRGRQHAVRMLGGGERSPLDQDIEWGAPVEGQPVG